MPGGDRTGPMGMGPMTGRGAGYCGGTMTPTSNIVEKDIVFGGEERLVFQRGVCGVRLGRGRGRGIKWRHWFYSTGQPFQSWVNPRVWGPERGSAPVYTQSMSKEAQIDMLKTEAADLEHALQEIRDRLAKISEEC